VNDWIDLNALVKILVGGLMLGAGLPALFAIGLRALHLGAPTAVAAQATPGATTGGDSGRAEDRLSGGNPFGVGIAVVCFAVVVAAIGWGIYWIVASS
jgi:hypothetical protein